MYVDEGEAVIWNTTFSDWLSEIIMKKHSKQIGEQNQLLSQNYWVTNLLTLKTGC